MAMSAIARSRRQSIPPASKARRPHRVCRSTRILIGPNNNDSWHVWDRAAITRALATHADSGLTLTHGGTRAQTARPRDHGGLYRRHIRCRGRRARLLNRSPRGHSGLVPVRDSSSNDHRDCTGKPFPRRDVFPDNRHEQPGSDHKQPSSDRPTGQQVRQHRHCLLGGWHRHSRPWRHDKHRHCHSRVSTAPSSGHRSRVGGKIQDLGLRGPPASWLRVGRRSRRPRRPGHGRPAAAVAETATAHDPGTEHQPDPAW
jgi:hypothetical protein